MNILRTHRLVALIVVALGITLSVQVLILAGITMWLVPGSDCVHDPAYRDPAPIAPDGQPANYLHTCGSRIFDSQGREVRITGLNWSGMEYSDYVPGGLGVRKWQDILDQIAALGYNTIRLPLTNETLEAKRHIGGVNFATNPDLQGLSGLGMLDVIVGGARDRGLKVILDRHRPTPTTWPPLWYNTEVPEERWIADWRMLAARYYGDDTVIGVDLHNEPRNPSTWGSDDLATDWRLAVERAGNAVHEVNPCLLVFVEGIEDYDGDHYWWGGNLDGVRAAPIRLRVPNRVVYSPHDYGPNLSDQVWFHAPNFPRNLPAEWDRRWGYIHREGIGPVVVGEFGGRSVGDDPEGQWQRTLLAYLQEHSMGALVWSLNPNWDTGGILAGDWQTVDRDKQEAYRQILAAPIDVGAGGAFGRAPTRLKVLFRQGRTGEQDGSIVFAFRIVNDGPEALDLSRLELRYWLRTGEAIDAEQQAVVDSANPRAAYTLADVVPTNRGSQDYYLRVRFAPGAGAVGRYQRSEEIAVRFPMTGWTNHALAGDYSFAGVPERPDSFREWDRATLYLDGRLVWGTEP